MDDGGIARYRLCNAGQLADRHVLQIWRGGSHVKNARQTLLLCVYCICSFDRMKCIANLMFPQRPRTAGEFRPSGRVPCREKARIVSDHESTEPGLPVE